jgi:ABC-2 type transport system ATP-binding protein
MDLYINNISYKYKNSNQKSLTNITFNVTKGSKHGIFGANGAGKSTLLKLICSVMLPTEGNVKFIRNEETISDKNEIKQFIGYVPQDFAFYEELTIWQNIKYFGIMFNIKADAIKQKYENLIQTFGLTQHTNKKLKSLSGGMKRKVNLMLGLIHDPKIIILDEPIVGIDIHSKNDILGYLNKLNSEGVTIIYTSHQMNESQSFCNNFTLLDKGENIVTGNLKEVLKHQNKPNLESILLTL